MSRPGARRNPRVALVLRAVLAVAAAMALVAPAARGNWAVMPHEVPVDRLLKNASRYIQEHPDALPQFLPWESILVLRADRRRRR